MAGSIREIFALRLCGFRNQRAPTSEYTTLIKTSFGNDPRNFATAERQDFLFCTADSQTHFVNPSKSPKFHVAGFQLTLANMIASAMPSQKILVVDDQPNSLHFYAKILENCGYQVDTALDGEAAWLELQVENYDLVITDNCMPKMTGMDLVWVLRDAQLTTPVIMSTGSPPANKFVLEPRLQPFLVLQKLHEVGPLLTVVGKVLPAPQALVT